MPGTIMPPRVDSGPCRELIDLSIPLETATPVSLGGVPFRMALNRHHGDQVRDDGGSGASEVLTLSAHTGTHIDALCHISIDGHLYGNVPVAYGSDGNTQINHGAESIPLHYGPAVLLDIPATFGLSYLPGEFAITADVLTRVCANQRTEVHPGTVVLIRTGWLAAHRDSPETFTGRTHGVPGVDVSGAAWMVEQQIPITGSDTLAYELITARRGHGFLPVHRKLIAEAGIFIIEMMWLDELAAREQFEFDIVLAPLKITGATGAPVRPIAVVSDIAHRKEENGRL